MLEHVAVDMHGAQAPHYAAHECVVLHAEKCKAVEDDLLAHLPARKFGLKLHTLARPERNICILARKMPVQKRAKRRIPQA